MVCSCSKRFPPVASIPLAGYFLIAKVTVRFKDAMKILEEFLNVTDAVTQSVFVDADFMCRFVFAAAEDSHARFRWILAVLFLMNLYISFACTIFCNCFFSDMSQSSAARITQLPSVTRPSILPIEQQELLVFLRDDVYYT